MVMFEVCPPLVGGWNKVQMEVKEQKGIGVQRFTEMNIEVTEDDSRVKKKLEEHKPCSNQGRRLVATGRRG